MKSSLNIENAHIKNCVSENSALFYAEKGYLNI